MGVSQSTRSGSRRLFGGGAPPEQPAERAATDHAAQLIEQLVVPVSEAWGEQPTTQPITLSSGAAKSGGSLQTRLEIAAICAMAASIIQTIMALVPDKGGEARAG